MTTQISGDTGVSQCQPNSVGAGDIQLGAYSPFIGVLGYFPSNNAPSGWIKANGALLSRAAYPALWAFAQTSGNLAASDGVWVAGQFSPGDGSTTFRVPDGRGEFARGWDDGRGVDAGRGIGTAQSDALQDHSHGTTAGAGVSGDAGNYGVYAGSSTIAGQGYVNGAYRTAAETRPRNIALLACIFAGV